MRIGVDVGGTNTDAVLVDGRDVLAEAKTPTTSDVTGGISSAIRTLVESSGVSGSRMHAVMIGTTHFTNAVVEARRLAQRPRAPLLVADDGERGPARAVVHGDEADARVEAVQAMTWITVLTLCFTVPVDRACIELAQYESREECRISAQRVRVQPAD